MRSNPSGAFSKKIAAPNATEQTMPNKMHTAPLIRIDLDVAAGDGANDCVTALNDQSAARIRLCIVVIVTSHLRLEHMQPVQLRCALISQDAQPIHGSRALRDFESRMRSLTANPATSSRRIPARSGNHVTTRTNAEANS
jgi:hypothetical protein